MIRLRCEAFVGGARPIQTNSQFSGWWNSQTMSRTDAEASNSCDFGLQYVAANCPTSVWSEFSHPTLLTGKLTQALYIVTVAIICFEGPVQMSLNPHCCRYDCQRA